MNNEKQLAATEYACNSLEFGDDMQKVLDGAMSCRDVALRCLTRAYVKMAVDELLEDAK